jgi:hypothetical protein
VASQTCEHCGSVVAGDEQFCPSCGSFMDPMSTPRPRIRPAPSSDNVISVTSDGPSAPTEGSYEEFSLGERPPAPDQPRVSPQASAPSSGAGNGNGRDISCPSCGAVNPANNRHCQECGARLRQGPLPTAPRPAVQATAGVRAALAISGLLLGVILIALFFNIFTGDDPGADASTTTTSTTAPVILEAGPIDILDETCTPQGIGNLICSNLTSGTPDEYQVSWEETSDEGIKIVLTFREPMAITEIHWTNIDDATRFKQNYRAKSLTITAQDSLVDTPVTLQDQQGTQVLRYTALNTTTLEITVVEAYQAMPVDDNVFDELAIDEIEVIGRPVTPTTNTTAPTDTGSTTTTGG